MIYSVVLVSSVQLSDSIIHKDILLLFQILFLHRLLSRVPCVIYQVLVGYLFSI